MERPVLRHNIYTAYGSSVSPVILFSIRGVIGDLPASIALHYLGTLGVTFSEGIGELNSNGASYWCQ